MATNSTHKLEAWPWPPPRCHRRLPALPRSLERPRPSPSTNNANDTETKSDGRRIRTGSGCHYPTQDPVLGQVSLFRSSPSPSLPAQALTRDRSLQLSCRGPPGEAAPDHTYVAYGYSVLPQTCAAVAVPADDGLELSQDVFYQIFGGLTFRCPVAPLASSGEPVAVSVKDRSLCSSTI
ncbi:hypothetical protein BDP81DRAFT_434119 [Colletotrichum phormii]|uniref:Uncharacterized protein n=1 Tax=Colletotrichum phormii TaxID=359342 RepID=A0AAI9ZMX7_9PEZI|nr:uncharacterized protein BDP81DRAFT_434119 [Colletotrichum phormii]KAK1633602.1 hypothetical protein BDP81DRAFT_434119 [Colletotrichum phormii]